MPSPAHPFAHVLWLGGPPDSGKTSVAALLAERHGARVYHFDRHERAHLDRADPQRHPDLARLRAQIGALTERELAHELWLAHPPEVMASWTIACWSQRVELAVADLRAMPASAPIIAEGPGFFPDAVFPHLADPRRAIWLLPTEDFKRSSATRRDKPGARHLTADPDRAQEHLIRRDLLLGEHIRQRVAALDLSALEIDGSRTLEEIATVVAARFAPWLGVRG